MLEPANDTPEALLEVLITELALCTMAGDYDRAWDAASDAMLEAILLKERLAYMKSRRKHAPAR